MTAPQPRMWEPTPPWMEQAECKKHPELSWFPKRGEPQHEQKAVCAVCPVRDDCLDYSLNQPPWGNWGIWGGKSERERNKIRRQLRTTQPS